jgi:hypothetical protein
VRLLPSLPQGVRELPKGLDAPLQLARVLLR